MTDDEILSRLRAVNVFIVTDKPIRATATWAKTEQGYEVTAWIWDHVRTATISDSDELDFVSSADPDLYLRDGWHQYGPGREGKHVDIVFMRPANRHRIPPGMRGAS